MLLCCARAHFVAFFLLLMTGCLFLSDCAVALTVFPFSACTLPVAMLPVSSMSDSCSSFVHGSTCSVSCLEGYVAIGAAYTCNAGAVSGGTQSCLKCKQLCFWI